MSSPDTRTPSPRSVIELPLSSRNMTCGQVEEPPVLEALDGDVEQRLLGTRALVRSEHRGATEASGEPVEDPEERRLLLTVITAPDRERGGGGEQHRVPVGH